MNPTLTLLIAAIACAMWSIEWIKDGVQSSSWDRWTDIGAGVGYGCAAVQLGVWTVVGMPH